MPLTLLTAYIIAFREDVKVTSSGPDENGKYIAWITLGEEDRFRPLLNSDSIYDSHETAQKAGRDTWMMC